MKHTKGPWTISENTEDKSKGPYSIQSDTCTIAGDVSGIGYDQAESNALLIAAAPELLEALNNLLNWGRDHISPVHNPEAHDLLVAAHNAINKATGTK